jgi:hypothetical protein
MTPRRNFACYEREAVQLGWVNAHGEALNAKTTPMLLFKRLGYLGRLAVNKSDARYSGSDAYRSVTAPERRPVKDEPIHEECCLLG